MTDSELLRRVQRGDLAAWRSLYARCLPPVWRQACALVGDRTAAEEVVGETMLALVRAIPGLNADAVQLHAWLRGVVRHKVADHGRQQARHRRLLTAARNGSAQDRPMIAELSPLEAEEDRQQVLAVLDQLTDLQRTLLEWKLVDELSVGEIAARVGQTEKSVESSLYRARREFRRLYERACSLPEVNGSRLRHESGTVEERT